MSLKTGIKFYLLSMNFVFRGAFFLMRPIKTTGIESINIFNNFGFPDSRNTFKNSRSFGGNKEVTVWKANIHDKDVGVDVALILGVTLPINFFKAENYNYKK